MRKLMFGAVAILLILYGFGMFTLGYWECWHTIENKVNDNWIRYYCNEDSQLDYWKLRAKKEGLE